MKHVLVFILLIAIIIVGCGTPQEISSEQLKSQGKLAIIATIDSDELSVFVFRGSDFSSTFRYGLLGTLYSSHAKKNVDASLGGDVDSLRIIVENISVMTLLNEHFETGFMPDIETIYPGEMSSLNLTFEPIKRLSRIRSHSDRNDYSKLKRKMGVDLVLEIEFNYGLTAYGGGVKPTAAIVADIRLIDTDNNKIKMMKQIRSDALYREGPTVDEFLLAGQEMFESELIAAIKSFVDLVSMEFGAERSFQPKSHWEPRESSPN